MGFLAVLAAEDPELVLVLEQAAVLARLAKGTTADLARTTRAVVAAALERPAAMARSTPLIQAAQAVQAVHHPLGALLLITQVAAVAVGHLKT
jgi:cytochrome b